MTVGLWVLLGIVAVFAFGYFVIQNISSQIGSEPFAAPTPSMDYVFKDSGARSISLQGHEHPMRKVDVAPQSKVVERDPIVMPGKNLALKGTSKERIKRILVNGQEVYKGPESDNVTLKISAKSGQHAAIVEEFEDAFRPTLSKSKRGITTQAVSGEVPVRGLVMMADPLEKLLAGRKTMELRSRQNRQLGTVALIRKGTGHIYGVADITESVGPMDMNEFRARMNEHGVESSRIQEVFDKGWTIGWRMANVKKLRHPVPYVHKGMSQVKLDDEAIAGLRVALTSAIQV